MVLLAIIASLFVAIQDPIVQKFAARFAGGYLSEKTGADIKVGQLTVTPDFRVFLDDVVVKDLKDNNLAKIGSLRTKIDMRDLMSGKLHLEDVELKDTEANLIQYEGEDAFNFAFLAQAFKSDKEKLEKEPMPITIDKISLKNVDFVYWNQNKDHPEKTEQQLMDYAHIDLDGINLEAKDFYMLGDSIHANICRLAANEISGLELKDFQSDVVVCSQGIFLDGMKMETNNSKFDLDLHMLYDDFSAFGDFVNDVTFDAVIRPTDVMLSDIGVFTPVMYKMPDRILFEGLFKGPIEHFRVDDIDAQLGNATRIQGNMSMHPLDFENGEHSLNIKNMHFSYDDLTHFYIPSKTVTIPLPESLRAMNEGNISLNFEGSYNNFESEVRLDCGVGSVDANIARAKEASGDNVFSGYLNGEGVDVGTLINNNKLLGSLDLNAGYSVRFPKKGNPELDVNGKVLNAELLGTKINEVDLDGTMRENLFKGKVSVDDEVLAFNFNGLVDFENPKYPKSNFNAVVKKADLRALNINKKDSISEISTRVYVNMKGFDLDNLEGVVQIDSTVYRDTRGRYRMDEFTASIVNDNLMQRRINMNCDFFDFEMAGKMNFASMMMSLNEYVDSFVHFPQWENKREDYQKYSLKHDVDQDFIVRLDLKDTKTISRLLMPSVNIAKNTTLNGTFTSRTNSLNFTLRSKNVQVGGLNFNDIELKNYTFRDAAFTTLKLDEVLYSKISETDTLELGVDNLSIATRMTNDTIFAHVLWDDDEVIDRNKAKIAAYYHPHELGGIFSIMEANVMINDSLWEVSPNNFVDLADGRVNISNLMFSHRQQSIRADGYVPMDEGDTLSVQMRRFDISNLDFLFKGFDIDGYISGDGLVSNVKNNPMVLADFTVERIGVNGEDIGDALIQSVWNNAAKSVELNAHILDMGKKTLNAYGAYYTARKKDNIDFTVEMDSLRLAALSPLLTGVVSRMQGFGNGLATIKGSPDHLDINGKLKLHDGGCKIGYLNTFYTFSPTILIDNNSIRFEDMVLVDTLGNKAAVEGQIKHNHLKDFYLDLRMLPRDFLALATTSKENDTFYGTAVANGLITVKGPFDDIKLDIVARTRKGTNLTIPLNQTATVKENDFIVFVSNEEEVEEEVVEISPKKKENTKSNFRLNLDVSATDDATLKIILPGDIGTIDASGNGRVKLGTSTKEPLTMLGDYAIKNGRFQLTLFNLISRTFNLKQGGTISWTGDPTDGRINATGVYTVKAPISGLGIQVDSTASYNNVNVECLIHLNGALLNPIITFGMNLPNATEDVTQTVFALVDTTNQAAMQSQAVSLLVLGQFAYAGGSGGADPMNLNNIFGGGMQFDITDNLNLGVSYHSGNDESYDEYQVAMRTALFENRLTIETNLGVMSSNDPSSSGTSNIVGEFDMYYKLSKDGRLMAHFYNHSNYNSNYNSFAFDRRAPYTQGLGLSFSKSANTFPNLFKKRKPLVPGQPRIMPRKQEND